MADVSFTAGSFVEGANAITEMGVAGETITAGLAVYFKTSDSKFWIASTVTSAATAAVAGYALNGAAADQPLKIQKEGDVTCDNLTLAVAGCVYVLSAAGETAPHGDLAADDYVTILGVALSTTSLRLAIAASGVQGTA